MKFDEKRLKRLIEMGAFDDKTILQMLKDEKILPENKGIVIYGSIIDTENDVDLLAVKEPL